MKTFKQFIKEYSLEDPPPKRRLVGKKPNPRGVTQQAVMGGARGVRGMVFRADNEAPPDNKLRTYERNRAGTDSGASSATKAPDPGYQKDKGQYAGPTAKMVSPFAGIERDESRVMTSKTLYTRKGAEQNRPTYITAYKASNFHKVGTGPDTGERFSRNPGKIVGQFKVQNPTQFRSRYRKEKQVKDIKRTFRRVRNRPDFQGAENI